MKKCLSKSGKGQSQVSVKLEGNPSTGFEWIYELSNPAVIKEVSYEYIGYQEDDEVVGVGGVFVFGFAGITEGETKICFSYLRTFEKDIPPEKTAVYHAIVDSNHTLTITKGISSL